MSKLNSSLLQEGGAGGHVLHPFEIADNGKEFLDLFDEVVDYVEQGSAGKPGSAWVKLDGINLSVRIVKNASGQYEFALDRGTQDPLDVRGITVDKLEARGMNPGLTQKAKILLDLLNPTIGSTMNHLKKLGLIQNSNLILNVEYVDNYQVNLVKYDIKNFIAIHGLRLITVKDEIVKKTGLKKREISDYPYNVDDINAYAKALTKILQKKEFVVLGNPEVKKSVDINLEPVLARTLTLNGVTKSLKNWILGIEDIPKKNGRAIIFTKKEYKEVDAGDKTGLTESQIRDYILYYATIYLGDVIMNSVRSELGKGSDQEGLMIKRKNGQILKITGRFILSGMEGLIAKQKSVEEAAESFTVGIMFGRFNPPHKGHIAAWDQMNKDSDLDAWYVGTNKSTIGKKDPLPSDVKEIVIKTLYPVIEDHFVFEQTWLTLAAYVYKKYKKDNMTLICYTDEGYVLDLLKDYNGKELKDGKNYLFSSIILRPTERISSASALRAAVKNDDKRSFSKAAGISADTEITVGSKKIAYFDLVKTYLQKYIEEAAQPKKYFARLSDSTAKKRKSFWKGLGKYPFTKSEYERADEVPGDSKETRPSKYNKKYKMMFGEEKKRSVTALKKKAKASGVPYSILKQVYNRGMAAWVTGHRPGATQSAWAFARVNSFLTKGKTWYGADADLAKKARKYLTERSTQPGEYVYHASYLPNLARGLRSILTKGLIPSKEGYGGSGVYFSYEPEGGFYHVGKEDATIFRAKWSDLVSKFGVYPDNLNGIQRDDDEIIVPGAVPAKMLEIEYFPDEWWNLEDVYDSESRSIDEAHMFPQYFDWGWIDDKGNIQYPDESDRTHTSILRRLSETNPEYNLGERPTESDATKLGWIRWLVEYSNSEFVVYLNTKKLNKTIKMYRSIERIVTKHNTSKVFSFESPRKWIQKTDWKEFMKEISKLFGLKEDILNEEDYEIEMISGQLKKIIDLSTDTLNVIQNGSEIPAWIQDKISVSTHNAEAIFDYYHYSESKDIQESVEIISETITCSKKTGKKVCFVLSKKGKKLGGPYSETKAKKRLRQIEFFKHLNK